MNSQVLSLLIAVGIGFAAFVILRTVFKVVSMGLNLILLIVVAAVAYFLLRDQIAALLGGG